MSSISRYNQTNSTLTNTSSWIGIGEDTRLYQGVYVSIESDKNCQATLQWSNDNSNWYWSDVVAIAATVPYANAFINKALYFRLSILNNSGGDMTRLSAVSRYINDVPDNASTTVSTSITSKPSVTATLWNAAAVVPTDSSSVADLEECQHVDIMGVTDGACNLDIQLSHNNTDWYNGPQIIVPGAGDIHASLTVGAQYLRVKVNTGSVTITLHADSKG